MEKNYTEEMVKEMVERYVAAPTRDTVEQLSEELNKPIRSIVSKLVVEKVYVAAPRQTKNGEPIVRKSDLVEEIKFALNIAADLSSLAKASKADLQRILNAANA